jgi:REP element-mobilizing transposase RayT
MSGDRYPILNQNGIYFITMTVVDWTDIFTRKDYSLILVDSFNYCIKEKNLEIFAWVIMSNHAHLVCKVNPPFQLSDVLRDLKKFTSKQIIKAIEEIPESRSKWLLDKFGFEARRTRRAKNYKVWKDDNHAIEIEDYISIESKIEYIHNNPVSAMIVSKPEDYIFSSAIDYAEGKGLVNVTIC